MASKYTQLVETLLPLVGGKENILQASHCMTRLRLNLKDYDKADINAIKKVSGVVGCIHSGGQLQIIIGTTVADVYDEFCKVTGLEKQAAIDENLDKGEKKKLTSKGIVDAIFAYLSGTLTAIIPVMIAASLCKTIVAVFGPGLLGVMSAEGDLYMLFTMVGDAGFYFLPILVANFAAKKLNVNSAVAMFIAGIMLHPTLIEMATSGTAFTVYGIPCSVQNYSSTVVPILLIVWIMKYVEGFFKKFCPDVLKVVGVPFGTLLVMLPIALCVLGPAGSILGNYVCNGIIALDSAVGPLAVAIIGAFFALMVSTGMHTLLFVYLFTTFPMLGFDSFLLPGILASSWAGTAVGLAIALRCKKPENRSTFFSYILTWFFGGVGEPMIYGVMFKYKSALVASVAAGGIGGFVAGLMGLKAYVLSTSNGMYGLLAFLGGPTFNYVALAATIAVSVIAGIAITMVLPFNENA